MAEYDVILYGATGFTGRQTATWFHENAPKGLKWAIAGRNAKKLAKVAGMTGDPPQIVADANNAPAVEAMVQQTRVLLTTAGPFAKYGDAVVDACVKHQVGYVDITGETPWVRRVIDRNHEQAARDGTKIVPFCGFDSVPSDLGTLMIVEHFRARDRETRHVSASFVAKGGLNGGTLDSALNLAESGDAKKLGDPMLLCPKPHRTKAARQANPDRRSMSYDADREVWLAPFFMAPVNTRVVRRSAALFADMGEAYGPDFRYEEAYELRTRFKAGAFTLVSGAVDKMLRSPFGRKVLKKYAPKPGEGPKTEVLDSGWFRARLVGTDDRGNKVLGTIKYPGDPGNRATVAMVCQSAICLATKADELPDRGGVLTPATAFGLTLLDAMKDIGFDVSVAPLS